MVNTKPLINDAHINRIGIVRIQQKIEESEESEEFGKQAFKRNPNAIVRFIVSINIKKEIDISLKLSVAKKNNGGKIAKINKIDTGRIMSTADLNIDVNNIVISMDQVKADATMVTLSMPYIAYNMDGIKMKGMRIEKNKVTQFFNNGLFVVMSIILIVKLDIMSKLPIIMEIMVSLFKPCVI